MTARVAIRRSLLAAGIAACTPPAVAPPAWSPGALIGEKGDTVPVHAGTLRVPERWWGPAADSLVLTIRRLPASGGSVGTPVVYLAGGPGGSSTQAARGDRRALFEGLGAVGEVVLFDQRGTSGADPFLICPEGLSAPLEREGTRAALLLAWLDWSRDCAEHWTARGVDLAAYHTEAAAHDLDAVRRAVGAERIHLVAISYGTQVAQAYARIYPDRVGRMVLAGPEPLGRTLKPIAQTERQLARLDSAVASDPGMRGPVPSLLALVDSVLTRLESRPERVEVVDPRTGAPATLTIGAYDVRMATAFMLGDRAAMLRLPSLYLAMAAEDYSAIARVVLVFRRYNTTAMAATTDCATGWSAEALEDVRSRAGRALMRDAANFPFPDICEAWPHTELGGSFRRPERIEAPTLFVAGTMDGRTPPENVDALAPWFPHHRRLILHGAAHDDDLFLSSSEIIPAVVAFLRGLPTPDSARLPAWRFGR